MSMQLTFLPLNTVDFLLGGTEMTAVPGFDARRGASRWFAFVHYVNLCAIYALRS
jgi:hypothetical protein